MKKFFALVLVALLMAGGVYSAKVVAYEETPNADKAIKVAHEEGPIVGAIISQLL